jgi:hypothetical protein
MSNEIKVSDRVTWHTRTRVRPYLHSVTGQVVNVSSENATVLAGHTLHIVALADLTKVGPIEAIVDGEEYAQLRNMGDLSGAELS